MKFSVNELPRAKSDKRAILIWIHERSPQGAQAWLDAYDKALLRIEQSAASFGEAFENKDCPDADVKQIFFKTRRGRVYRLLYLINETNAYVVRVLGPGQAPVHPADIK